MPQLWDRGEQSRPMLDALAAYHKGDLAAVHRRCDMVRAQLGIEKSEP
jgi:hypothetical protein